jgi:hypothetical protein
MRQMSKTARIAVRRLRLISAAVVLACPTLAPAREALSPVAASEEAPADAAAPSFLSPLPAHATRANFLDEAASQDARQVANWAVSSGDNNGLPFMIIDKIRAKVFVFDSAGRLRGATLALLGRARGDDTVPGIGSRRLATIRPEERTTPAGRFVAVLGHDFDRDILWIDYGAAISLHRVITGDPGDHRLQRLATTSTVDKRISYGCINVPVKFYETVVLETFSGGTGIVYILPEVKTLHDVFPLAEVDAPSRQ